MGCLLMVHALSICAQAFYIGHLLLGAMAVAHFVFFTEKRRGDFCLDSFPAARATYYKPPRTMPGR